MRNADLVFSIANWFVLVGWAALLLAPLRRDALVLVARVVAAAVCAMYAILVVRGLAVGPGLPEGAGFGSLDAVVALLSTRGAMLAGWIHYLAFDLFVASWMLADAPRAGVPHWVVVPLLGLTLMMGPVGLLVYLLVAGMRRRGRPAA
ncbi:ABA4-like family protein [Sandaracinobacteroides hominis]|uniref:ABA4-like family protein n=1 Tax=Sandaracinobacteroides hominis TaxID=2780086 RepID=UPI0018F65AB8|nr:ABA4-like family protein [Sandaracinobacteroides hominis]